ncbi:gamma-glutamyltransferase [Clostridium vitabionis]|uniref:gamma-glutamyltransferase n=1 Tax=Clostridium vitabionis TaxID=2784388 RepID=UPI00188C9833|nr:gamma-glutamyltransferase [Clostridium vitabionis]
MKKHIALGMALLLGAGSVTACGGSKAAQTAAPETTVAETESAAAETAAPETFHGEEVWLPYDENLEKKKTDRDATGKNGAVASCSWYASKAGLDVLQNGGNAFDAAAAVGYTLGVVEPYFSGLGGGGFMTLYDAKTKKVSVIDFRETAPAAATADMFLDESGQPKNYTPEGADATAAAPASQYGGASVAVPGEVAGLEYLLEHYGSGVDRKDIFQDAIDLANDGYVVTATFKEELDESYNLINAMPEIAGIYLNDGLPRKVGDHVKNPDLAKTLENIRDNGKDAFYTGDNAQKIVDAVQKYGGVLTASDLENYTVKEREPVEGSYQGYTIYSLPPASSGGTHLCEILNILENADMKSLEVNSPEYVHMFSEAFKIAFADRAKYMADTDFADVPLKELTSKEYAKWRYSQIDPEKSGTYEAVPSEELEHYATTSFSVVDKDGNMVACTQTVNYGFGSKIVPEGTGFCLNDEMDDFACDDPSSTNCVEGGKRPLSSMSPSIVLYPDGTPFMTIGTPGATRIFPTIAQVVQKMIDYDMPIQDAIDCARIYDNSKNNINYESDGVNPVTAETAQKLQAMGHEVTDKGAWQLFFGGVQGISIDKDGTLHGGADPRRDGKALAY